MPTVFKKDGNCENLNNDLVLQFNPPSDHFQNHAYNGIHANQVILTSAPTGSGKTRIIHYAVAYYLKHMPESTVIITTPIKALSNQKYKEFVDDVQKFSDAVGYEVKFGLMTGDIIINPDANCIIMTTEILNESLNNFKKDSAVKETHLKESSIDKLSCVIFDEAHYFNDKDRGHVWESILIKLNQKINVVLVSATFPNIEFYANWLAKVRDRDVCMVLEKKRIIPLIHHIFVNNECITIMKENNFNQQEYDKALKLYKTEQMERMKKHKSNNNYSSIDQLIEYMKKKDILQTLFFVFSKKNCEIFADNVTKTLIDFEQRAEMEKIFESKMNKHKKYEHVDQYIKVKSLLQKGICFHHADMIPVLKEVVEILFAKGLIKILFVTETMAAGLNMPAKAVVFTSLEKYSDEGQRELLPHEYIQMAGRAGRRGYDTIGHVFILPIYDLPDVIQAKNIMDGKMEDIRSRMLVDYSTILKMIGSNNVDMFYEKSLCKVESDSNCNQYLEEYIEKKQLYDEINKSYEFEKDYEILYEYEKKSHNYNGIIIKPPKQIEKQLLKIRKNISTNKEISEKYNNYKYMRELGNELENLNENANYDWISHKKAHIMKILIDMKFIKYNIVPEITISGILAAQINECNPLLLSSILLNDIDDNNVILYGLTPQETVTLLTIFIIDSRLEDRIQLESTTLSQTIINRIKKIHKIIDNYKNIEKLHHYDNDEYWDLSYNYVDAISCWANGGGFAESMELIYGEFASKGGGSFIKHILKLNNIVGDLISLCKVCNNLKLIPTLQEIESLIVRDEVSKSSLYVE